MSTVVEINKNHDVSQNYHGGVIQRNQYSINCNFRETHGIVKSKLSLDEKLAKQELRIQCPNCDFKIKA